MKYRIAGKFGKHYMANWSKNVTGEFFNLVFYTILRVDDVNHLSRARYIHSAVQNLFSRCYQNAAK